MPARFVTATVLVAFVLAACGSNDNNPDAAPADSVPSTSASVSNTSGATANPTPTGSAATPDPSADGSSAPAATGTAAGSQTTVAAAATPSSLQFTVPLVGGGELDGSRYTGRPVAFWFWAPT